MWRTQTETSRCGPAAESVTGSRAEAGADHTAEVCMWNIASRPGAQPPWEASLHFPWELAFRDSGPSCEELTGSHNQNSRSREAWDYPRNELHHVCMAVGRKRTQDTQHVEIHSSSSWLILPRAGSGLKMEKARNLGERLHHLPSQVGSPATEVMVHLAFTVRHRTDSKQVLLHLFLSPWISRDFAECFCSMTFTFILWRVVVEGVKLTRKEEWPIKSEP